MSAPVFEGNLRAATGSALSARGWHQEAALRMLHNNLDPAVAERPEDLIVYGGSGAVGGAVAKAFAREGARVFIAARRIEPLEAAAADIRADGGRVEVAPVDATDPDAVAAHLAVVVDRAGPVKLMFNAIDWGDTQGQPIPGLYAAGNTSASIMGRSYPGAGGTIGPAMCFGFIGAEAAKADGEKAASTSTGSEKAVA